MRSVPLALLFLSLLTPAVAEESYPPMPRHGELQALQENVPQGNILELVNAICVRGQQCTAPLLNQMESGSELMRDTLEKSFNSAYCQNGKNWEGLAERYPRLRGDMISCFKAWQSADCDYYTGRSQVITLPGCRTIAKLE